MGIIYKCFFDGACEPKNPGGNMGIGAIIYKDDEVLATHSHFVEASASNSNNVAEYKAFLCVLDTLLSHCIYPGNEITIAGDSMLVVKQCLGLWKIKGGLYAPYALEAKTKLQELKEKATVLISWIPGHTNIEADKLSRRDIPAAAFRVRTKKKKDKYYRI